MTQLDWGLEDERTWDVGELAERIRAAIAEEFRELVWVRGQVAGLKRPNQAGHQYFELVDRRGHADRQAPVLACSLFNTSRQRLERAIRAAHGVPLADGVEVRLGGQVEYWPPTGKVTFKVTAIDPAYTLGRMAAERDRALRALASEGLLDRQKALALPALPLRVGLVASRGTAGYADFVRHLLDSGLAFRIVHADARVSGPAAPASVARAVRYAATAGVDVVVVLRGGGGRADLAVFDAERIARAICNAPVPVITGIGHEVDQSVADAVAHTALKTPTACAAHLVDRARAWAQRVEVARAGVGAAAARVLQRHAHRVDRDAIRLARAVRGSLDVADQALGHTLSRAVRGAHVRLAAADTHLTQAAGALGRVPRRLDEAARALDAYDARIRLLDPARLLARGWSITTRADGILVRTAGDVSPGDELVTTLADGAVRSRVLEEGQ